MHCLGMKLCYNNVKDAYKNSTIFIVEYVLGVDEMLKLFIY